MNDLSIEELIDHLHNNPDPAARAEAARILGEIVPTLDTGDAKVIVRHLNEALKDSDPNVLMAVMAAVSSMTSVPQSEEAAEEIHDDEALAEAAVCCECGRPEPIVHLAECARCGKLVCENHWIQEVEDNLFFCSENCAEEFYA